MEGLARVAIGAALNDELKRHQQVAGIAGGASGGDILFHEVCGELGVPTTLWLALPPDRYVVESVAPAGGAWVERFHALYSRARVAPVFAPANLPPPGPRQPFDSSIWQQSDLAMLDRALSAGVDNVTVMALWNGKAPDKAGGIADIVAASRARGVRRIVVLDSNQIFGLDPRSGSSHPSGT